MSRAEDFESKVEEIEQWFEELNDEYLDDDKVDSPLHPRRDIAAFLLLHKIVGGTRNIIAAAEHDEIFLDASLEDLAKAGASRVQVLELIRYGVRLNDGSLSMFA